MKKIIENAGNGEKMYKIFVDGIQVETVMYDDDEELRRYLMNKYWEEGIYPTYIRVRNTEKCE